MHLAKPLMSIYSAETVNQYPDALGYEQDFKVILRQWRPELAD